MVFNQFSECINRAPGLILGNANYVKKVIFPLEVLPVVVFGSAAFHFLVSFLVWLVFYIAFIGVPHLTIFLLPVAILPLVFITLGLAWFLASMGVYLRDVSQIIGVVTTILLFLSPIFYPIDALPEQYRAFMQISPLSFVVEVARGVMIWGKGLDWIEWLGYTLGSLVVVWLGFAWFQKTRTGFADVL